MLVRETTNVMIVYDFGQGERAAQKSDEYKKEGYTLLNSFTATKDSQGFYRLYREIKTNN